MGMGEWSIGIELTVLCNSLITASLDFPCSTAIAYNNITMTLL